jgi:hypothetical protein
MKQGDQNVLYFDTRDQARAFANRTGRQVSDLKDTGARKRWGVQVVS